MISKMLQRQKMRVQKGSFVSLNQADFVDFKKIPRGGGKEYNLEVTASKPKRADFVQH